MSDDTDARLAALEQHQESTDSKLDELLDLIRGKNPDDPAPADPPAHETRDQRSVTIAEYVRAELDRRQKDADDKQEKQTMRQQLAEVQAALREKPPQPPQPRRQKAMWGDRDR